MEQTKRNLLAPISVLLSGMLWGSIGIYTRWFSARGIRSSDITFLRLLIGTAFLFTVLLVRDRDSLKIRKKDFWLFPCSGICSILFFQICYLMTIRQASLSTAAILLYTSPVFVTLFSFLFFREKLTLKKILAALLSVFGCALVSGFFGTAQRMSIPTLLIGLGSGIGYALYSIFSRAALNRGYSSLAIPTWSFFFALLPLACFADYASIWSLIRTAPLKTIGMWILMSLTTAAFPYMLYTYGLTGMDTGKAAVTAAIEPIVATLIGIFLYHETMTPEAALGTMAVLGAILLSNRQEKQRIHNPLRRKKL